MYRKQLGFTMIELVFTIVIVGILAAVALPRLSATREDAINSKDCYNVATCIMDLESEYTLKNTATKSVSQACRDAEASTHNNITITVNSKNMIVNGAPIQMCNRLNDTYVFGGTNISL